MRRLLLLLICGCVAALSNAQTLSEYLQLRKSNGINSPAAISVLDNIAAPRVVELSTTIKGSFKVETAAALMIEKSDGSTAVVDCKSIPDWLVGNEVQARLLVKVWRDDDTGEEKLELLGAAPESDVAPHDKVAAPPAAKKKGSSRLSRTALPSRHLTYRMRLNETASFNKYTPRYANWIKGVNPRLTDDEALAIAHFLIQDSLKYGVDARLIVAMVLAESSFNPWATSRTGAQGLGQLMPGTANGLGVGNSYDIEQNLDGMVRMVRGLLDTYQASTGDETKTLYYTIAAYNAGAGAVRKYGGIPPYAETQNYVVKVVNYYRQLTANG